MTLNINQLRARVAEHFSDIAQVDESVIRCSRRRGGNEFAVYFLDVAESLPDSIDSLTRYQDRIIGRSYFDGRKSLQWNNYLYFVRSKEQLATGGARQQKEIIERDRTYARKFVIAEEELESVLTPPQVLPPSMAPRSSVLSLWIERLAEKGLDGVILSNDDLPTRLALIESSPSVKGVPSRSFGKNVEVEAAQKLHLLELKQYRRYPTRRTFDFGRVNLFFGANGTGKTSLLEAIELFYCGKNARNRDAIPVYELIGVLENGEHEDADSTRSLQLFRNRNLTWYGQSEIKTNNLYQSFAQFNFLDTDAASSLADSTSRIEEDLSKLLIGPDASKTWAAIERVSEAVTSQLRGLTTRLTEATEELALLTKQVEEIAAVEKQSDLLYARLLEMINREQWRLPQESKEAQARQLVTVLAELVSITAQAVGLSWIASPVSLEAIRKYCSAAKETITTADAELSRLDTAERNQRRQENEVKKQEEAADLVRELRRLADADVERRAKERADLQSAVATHSGWLAGLDMATLRIVLSNYPSATVSACHAQTMQRREAAQAALIQSKQDYANYSKLRDESQKLQQQLRQIAGRILSGSKNLSECPLCHTKFSDGSLIQHIEAGLDKEAEANNQAFLRTLQDRERAAAEAGEIEEGASWLRAFCKRAGLSEDKSVDFAISRVEEVRKVLAADQNRLSSLDTELRSLESRGFSMDRVEELRRRVRELGWSVGEIVPEALEQLSQTVSLRLQDAVDTLGSESTNVTVLRQSLELTLGTYISRLSDLRVGFSQLKENLAITESVQARLLQLSANYPWPDTGSLAEMTVAADAIRNVAAELQAALVKEKQDAVNYSDWVNRIEKLKARVGDLRERIDRLTNAKSTFEALQENHSLKQAMEDALLRNRLTIERIFSRIHSPAEFTGLGEDWATLRRKSDGSEAKLSEISTGQRAAFALSIFLAQNAQLTVGPPILLIDDPIAHVDDLNALSFLDYLREIALSEKRQIFFATANDKLATLFERKFDFLGQGEFRRFDLQREAD